MPPTTDAMYRLSVNRDFANAQFKKLVKKYETDRIACAKYNLTIVMYLRETDDGFVLKKIKCIFLDAYNGEILESLNTLTEKEKAGISAACDSAARFLIINLVRMYGDTYKYLFIPFLVDYGRNTGIVHQCAFLIDLERGIFIFYEPYGTYSKYGKGYAETMREFVNIYADVLPRKYTESMRIKSHVRFTTFHEMIGRPIGIQSIIMEKNNRRFPEFERQIGEIVARFKSVLPDDLGESSDTGESDKTVNSLNLLDFLYKQKHDYSDALSLYNSFSSKNCVSITLIELNEFFADVANSASGTTDPFKKVNELYKMLELADMPNESIVRKLVEFITL